MCASARGMRRYLHPERANVAQKEIERSAVLRVGVRDVKLFRIVLRWRLALFVGQQCFEAKAGRVQLNRSDVPRRCGHHR